MDKKYFDKNVNELFKSNTFSDIVDENNQDFCIQKYVVQTLKPLGIPVYFSSRKENVFPFIMFQNTGESGEEFWDNQEQVTRYRVCLNIFSKDNYFKIFNQTKKLMLEAGFIRNDIPAPIYYEDIDVYNQPMFFLFYKENY